MKKNNVGKDGILIFFDHNHEITTQAATQPSRAPLSTDGSG